jgi:hypothetical protein
MSTDERSIQKLEEALGEKEEELRAVRFEKNHLEQENRRLKRQLKARDDYSESNTHSQLLLSIAREEAELFRDPKGEPYATFAVGAGDDMRFVTARIDDAAFTEWWRYRFYDAKGKPPSAQAVSDAKKQLKASARYDGGRREVHLRVASHDGAIYIDLADDSWHAVRVTERTWSIVQNPPVKFRRPAGMKPLPRPVRGGSLELLREHVNVRGDDDFALLLGWIVQALNPDGPYPVLPIFGEHGSGKTTAEQIIRSLVDPSHIPTRTAPNQEQDLVIAAENGWVLAFDNMSHVQPWLSDALCRLSTGGGFGTRKLYEDREEEIFYATRPLVLNGIEDLTTRPDLADRSVVLHLESIADENRRTQRQVWSDFREDRPEIFGAILDALVTALRRFNSVELDSKPRMADFAHWAVAAEPEFPVPEGTFMQAYAENRDAANETALEADPVASAVRNLLRHKASKPDGSPSWMGTMGELLNDLLKHVPNPDNPPKDFPSSHQALTSHLRRVMPVLRDAGIEREDSPAKRDRRFRLKMTTDAGDAEGAPF